MPADGKGKEQKYGEKDTKADYRSFEIIDTDILASDYKGTANLLTDHMPINHAVPPVLLSPRMRPLVKEPVYWQSQFSTQQPWHSLPA